jgi:hypothetical protein
VLLFEKLKNFSSKKQGENPLLVRGLAFFFEKQGGFGFD